MAESTTTAPTATARFTAEALGTCLLVLAVTATALLASRFPMIAPVNDVGVGHLGVALAAGLAVLAGAYALGHISGGHFNPAVTLGLFAAGRFPGREIPRYVIAQLIGGAAGAGTTFLLALWGPEGLLETVQAAGFASNGYGDASPGGYGLMAVLLIELLATALFVVVILGATDARANPVPAGLAIGLSLAVIHIATIPISNTSVNPARSVATAIFGGPLALEQLWAFIVAPLLGAVLGGLLYRGVLSRRS